MRVEATVPDSRATALGELADELGLSRSQIIDEALALFLKAIMEVRQGRRLVSMGPSDNPSITEIVTPTLAQIEWTTHRQALTLPADAVNKMARLSLRPPRATTKLRRLMKPRS